MEETGIVFTPMCMKCGNIITGTVSVKRIPMELKADKNKDSKINGYIRVEYEIQPAKCEKCGARFTKIIMQKMCSEGIQ